MGDRKARLAALAAKAGRSKPVNNNDDAEEDAGAPATNDTTNRTNDEASSESQQEKSVAFRNYAPKDVTLRATEHEEGDKDEEEEPASKKQRTESTKSALQQALEEAKQEAPATSGGDIEESAPKKINWDLKRDIAPKLEKLEKRTQRAIVELLKERLESEAKDQTNDNSDDSDLD